MPPEEVVEDRRTAIAAAFDSAMEKEDEPSNVVEKGLPPAAEPPATRVKPEQAEGSEPDGSKEPGKPEASATPEGDSGEDKPADDKPVKADRAPQSWRAPTKAKWEAVDPEVKQEVLRREREVTRALSETSQARQIAQRLGQAVQPYQQRLQAMGADPIKAVGELLKADYLLATGAKHAKAQMIAKFIKDYDVDVAELDGVLSGQKPLDPVESRVEQLLQQRLAPFQQFMSQAEQERQRAHAAREAELGETIATMEDNPNFPHFDSVRVDMGDIIDLNAKRGVYLSLEQAYSRAIAMNPEISQAVTASAEQEAKRVAAEAANARAQRALRASKSVGGSPSGLAPMVPPATDRRATIAAAFDALEGR